jgi:glutamate racemase
MTTLDPIGVFDSGIGGLSVWNELVKEIPNESLIYFADSANAPYGTKSKEFIVGRSRAITEYFVDRGCKLVVMACNTATGSAISTLRREFSIPFVGVEPAIKPAAMDSKTGHIGVLATAQTFKGEHFMRSIQLFGQSVEVHETVGTGLVELIEEGMVQSRQTRDLLNRYLKPMIDQRIDHLVLGCTHYPFLIPVLREILPEGIQIVDPAPAVARQTRKVLTDMGVLNPGISAPAFRFLTTGEPLFLSDVITQITGEHHQVTQVD